jgi:glycosyltransferase involved in cell wall biosynthesis
MHHCVHDPDFLPYKTLSQALYHRAHIRRIERAVLRGASAVIADSLFTAERTQAVFGKMRVQVIPLGIEIPDAPSVAHTRSAHMPFRLLFVGSASRRKGVDLLLPIMTQLGSSFELWVVGARQFDSRLSSQNIKFKGRLGTKEELRATYHTADALLFPSRLEGFGLVCAEAMACGLPVITTQGSSLIEVVRDGVTGILCPRDDVGAFVAAATRLDGDPALFAHMSQAAISHARSSFSLRRMVDDYMQVYRSCI